MAAVVKVWRQIKNLSNSRCILCEEQSCRISFWSDLKRRTLDFWRGLPNKNDNKKSSDMKSTLWVVPYFPAIHGVPRLWCNDKFVYVINSNWSCLVMVARTACLSAVY